MKENKVQLITDSVDIYSEAKYTELNSRGFVRGRTEQHQWCLLLNEAWEKTKLPKDDTVVDYLATMLNRFTGRVELFDQLKTFNYAEYVFKGEKLDSICTQDVADLCLQFVSFFPNQIKDRHQMKSYDYIVDLGVTLYKDLAVKSDGKGDWYSENKAYKAMADYFGSAIIVLRSTYSSVIPVLENSSNSLVSDAVQIPSDIEAVQIKNNLDRMRSMYVEDLNSTASKNLQ